MRKNTQKLLSLFLAIMMLVSLFPTALAEETEDGFEIAESFAATEAVSETASGGVDQGLFVPEEPVAVVPDTPETDFDIADPAGEADLPSEGEITPDEEPVAPTEPELPENEQPANPEETDGAEAEPTENTGDDEAEPEVGEPVEPAEDGEETDSEDAEAVENEEDDKDEEDEEQETELPYGFVGMPEDYKLSAEELAAKRTLTEKGVVEALRQGAEYVKGKLLLSTDSQEYAELVAAAYNAELTKFNGHYAVLMLKEATVPEAIEVAADLELPMPAVEPDWIVRAEPIVRSYGNQTDLQAQGIFDPMNWQTWFEMMGSNADPLMSDPNSREYQYQHDMVNSYEAWGVTTGSPAVTVAVLDTAVYPHVDLGGYVGAINEVADDVDYSMETHGTHVAGIIGATMGNGILGAGIAPGVSLYSVRVLGPNGGSQDDIAQGILDAANPEILGADIINMSLGSFAYSQIEKDAIDYAYSQGVTVIAAAGNNGSNIMCYPAAYNHVISVASVDEARAASAYTNFGGWCDVSAPGTNIWSTTPGDDYDCYSGTSMAAPVVSGVAALYMSVYGNPGPAAMKNILRSAVNKSSGSGMGTGVIDASKLFSGEKRAPVIKVYDFDADGNEIPVTDGKATTRGYIRIESASGYTTADSRFLCTENGKNPAVKNGDAAVGWLLNYADSAKYHDNDDGTGYYTLSLALFQPGVSKTLKVREVNGIGVASKISTLKLKIVEPDVSTVSDDAYIVLDAPESVISGKTIALNAAVYANYEEPWYNRDTLTTETRTATMKLPNQSVTWSLADPEDTPTGVKLDPKTGNLTVAKNAEGGITVRAYSSAYDVDATAYISIDTQLPVGKIGLYYLNGYGDYFPATSMTAYAGYSYYLPTAMVWDTDGDEMEPDRVGLVWSSSKPAVADIVKNDEGYLIEAKSAGSTKIKARATDGSGKSAIMTFTVKRPIQYISISGQRIIVPGATASYKGGITPSNASSKKLYWFIGYINESGWVEESTVDGISIDHNSGKVKVAPDVEPGTEFTVCAFPANSQQNLRNVCNEYSVIVGDRKATSVRYDIYGNPVSYTRDKSGNITGITLYSVDLPSTGAVENEVAVEVARWAGADVLDSKGISVANKTPSVASCDEEYDGYFVIHAKKAGSTTVTFTANDGSKKKTSLKITVKNPVSYLNVKSKNAEALNSDDIYFIGIGKSAGNTVSFGDTYGKPANTGVKWSYDVYQMITKGTESYDDYGYVIDYTEEVSYDGPISVPSGSISLDKNGKLTVSKKFANTWNSILEQKEEKYNYFSKTREYTIYDVVIEVTATSKETGYLETPVSDSIMYIVTAAASKIWPDSKSMAIKISDYYTDDPEDALVWYMPIYYNGYWSSFKATSSKPEIAGVVMSGNYAYIYPGQKTGTATITVKSVDGSNKSCKFTVKVVK